MSETRNFELNDLQYVQLEVIQVSYRPMRLQLHQLADMNTEAIKVKNTVKFYYDHFLLYSLYFHYLFSNYVKACHCFYNSTFFFLRTIA